MAAPEAIFKTLSLEQLQMIAKHERIHERVIDLDLSKKKEVVKAVSREATDSGVRQLVSLFKLATLKDICEPLDLDMKDKNPNSKNVYQKRLKEKMVEMGVAEFLEEYMDEKRLKMFIDVLGEEPESEKKSDLIGQATRLINIAGVSTFLSNFETPFLRELMGEMKLKCKTDNKSIILEAIALQTEAKGEASSSRSEISFSKSKKAIEKGITYQDIFQHYLLEELVDYCRENELKVSGKKPEVINRILDFLDGDLENTKAVNRSEKKSEKKEEAKKEKKTEKKAEKKTEKSSKKKAEKKESESEGEEEEEEVKEKEEPKAEKTEEKVVAKEKQASPSTTKKPTNEGKKKTQEKVEKEDSDAEASEEETKKPKAKGKGKSSNGKNN